MKKKQGLLVMLLGCLVIVTAIAGVMVWQGTDKKEDENNQYMELNDSSKQLLWNDEETLGTEEETAEAEKTTEETANEIPETKAATGILQEEASEEEPSEQEQMELPSEAPAVAGQVNSVSFNEANKLMWPVEGNVIMEYSMDRTVYFPTLEEYKCSPAVLIQGVAGTSVKAAADAIVKAVGNNEELGNYVTLDLGNAYELTCGQLTDIAVNPGDYVEKGAAIANLADPTKYYVVEGPNLYFQMTKDGAPIDPLDYVE